MAERIQDNLDTQIANLHRILGNGEEVTMRTLAVLNLTTLEALNDIVHVQQAQIDGLRQDHLTCPAALFYARIVKYAMAALVVLVAMGIAFGAWGAIQAGWVSLP